MEEWRDIKGYEGIYMVSSYGRVKSLKRRGVKNDRLLSTPKNPRGYRVVSLHKYGIQIAKDVHVLVAIAFLNHTPDGHSIVVDHINNDKSDNRVDNLQLITQRENSSKDRAGTSKYTGVSWDTGAKKWRAQIMINGKKKFLGYFETEKEAAKAYNLVTN